MNVNVNAVFSKYSITPLKNINFGPMQYGESITRSFEIRNEGMFDFKFAICDYKDEEAKKRIREEKIKEIIKNSPNVRELEEEKLKKKLERLARGEVKPSRTGYSCSVCGHALDVSLKEEGRHLLC